MACISATPRTSRSPSLPVLPVLLTSHTEGGGGGHQQQAEGAVEEPGDTHVGVADDPAGGPVLEGGQSIDDLGGGRKVMWHQACAEDVGGGQRGRQSASTPSVFCAYLTSQALPTYAPTT